MFCTASIYSLLGVSLDRLLAVFRPVGYSQAGPRLQAGRFRGDPAILVPWLAGAVLAGLMWVNRPGLTQY